ncbi:helix-turn-helix domain-containing protein [Streptomyces sp. NPDC053048]|uniref:nSTAND1 domain-containing NTPase n=1 Tax=Streptomyces sp. NPDC053048 TaxID=3365694 RepID=UPI0037D3CBD6
MRQREDDADRAPVPAATVAPGEQLRRLRQERGMSLAGLSDLVHYTKSYLSRVETGEKPMTPEVARRCEGALRADGQLSGLVARAAERRGTRGAALEVCPYRGLTAFGTAEAGWFFGRERATAALVHRLTERLDGSGPTAVVAASGTGKSSLLQAGLVPALRRGVLPVNGSSRWPVLVMRPGERPLEELTARVAEATGAGTDAARLREALDEGPRAFAGAVHTALNDGRRDERAGAGTLRRRGGGRTPGAEPVRLVLVVDQFEEVFTLCPDAREHTAFVRALHALATGPAVAGGRHGGSAALVVLGMRADFYGRCLAFPELAAALRDGQLPLEPMRPREIRDAVVRPARAVGLELEPGLVEIVLRDLGAEACGEGHGDGHEPGALPLLSHALLATWQRRRERTLTVEGYQQAGGIAGAVAATAERAYARLSPDRQEAARSLLLHLVRVDAEGRSARRRVPRELLARQAGSGAGAALEVVEEFTRARLLTADADRVTLAHEAVLRAWPRLREWIETHAALLHGRQQLSAAAEQWDAEGRDPALLPRGSRLTAVRELAGHPVAPVSDVEQAFVDAATAQAAAELETERRHTRRLHRLLACLAVLLVLTLAGGALAFHQSRQALAERGAARAAELAFRAASLSTSRPEVSMLLATAAWRQAHTPAAAGAVLSSQAQSYAGRLTGHHGPALAVAWQAGGPRGGRLLSAGADGTVREWDTTRTRQTRVVARAGEPVRALAVARNSDLAAWGDDAGAVSVWDGGSGRPVATAAGAAHRGPVRAVALSGRGELLASAGRDGTVRLSHPAGGAPGAEVRDTGLGPLYAVAVTGDGRRVAAAGLDGRVWLLDVPGRRSRVVGSREHGRIRSLAFSPDGRHLATGEWNGTVGLWNCATGAREASLRGAQDSVFAVAFSPDGGRLAAASQDDTAAVWDVAGRRRIAVLSSHLGPVHGVAFAPDGRSLATSGEDGTLRLWSPQSSAGIPLPGTAWLDAALSPDRSLLAAAGRDGTVRLWRPREAGHLPVRTLRVSREPVRAVAFSHDGALLAAGDEHGGATVWRTASPERPVRRWRAHARAVTSVAFRPGDRRTLATGGEDHTAKVWRATGGDAGGTPRLRRTLTGHGDAVYRVLFLDGATLATGSLDNTARVWRVSDGRELQRLAEHADTVLGLAVGPTGILATAGRDHTVRLWDPREGRGLRTLAGHTAPVTSVAFNPSGTRLATTGRDNTVRIWDAHEGKLLLTLTGHTDRVRAAAFLADEGPVVSVAEDGSVRWWRLDVPAVLAGTCRAVGRVDAATWRRLLPDVPYGPGCP